MVKKTTGLWQNEDNQAGTRTTTTETRSSRLWRSKHIENQEWEQTNENEQTQLIQAAEDKYILKVCLYQQ